MKKSISVMLVLSIIVSLFAMCCVTSFAEEITSGKCGENAFWEYDADSKTITVSGKGSLGGSLTWKNIDFVNFVVTDEISYIHGGVLGAEHSVENIFISGNVKCITDYAFSYCPNLKKIELGYGIETLEVGPFANNPALETVNIPGSVKTFMGCTFANCVSLKNVVLGEGIKEITDAMFLDCVSLESLVLPESIKYINADAFNGCKSLAEISIPAGVEYIGIRTFFGCESLKKMEIPASVKEIEKDAFADCSSMKEIYIYNKNCFIKDETSIDKNVTIYGYTNSTAELYANKYNRKFVALDNDAFSAFVRFFDSFVQLVKTLFNQLLKMFSFK